MKMNRISTVLTLLGLTFTCTTLRAAEPAPNAEAQGGLRLPAIFSDHMVLQRDLAVPVWGRAAAEEEVRVSIAGQSAAAKAGADGKWKVSLKPIAVTDSTELVVKGKDQTITVKDVAVGEVWVCSGQSNMEKPLGKEAGAITADPGLRMFTVEKHTSLSPLADAPGSWVLATPEAAKNFSAVGYYFSRELRNARKVPVGMIHSSWGATTVLAWTSLEGLEQNPQTLRWAKDARKLRDDLPNLLPKYQAELEAYKEASKKYAETVWNPYMEARKVRSEEQRQAKTAGKPIPGDVPAPTAQKPREPNHPDGGAATPTSTFNGMIAPLIPYAIKGVVWYQGESNHGDVLYQNHQAGEIADWRHLWQQGDFPFIFVQLPPFHGHSALLRDSQLKVWETVPGTAMVVSTDCNPPPRGLHPGNIHKAVVGARLALAARAIAYGESLEYSGPLYQSMRVDGQRAILSFTHCGKGLVAKDGELQDFTVAGEDRTFVPAKATIVENTVVVSSEQVALPVAVRFGWSNEPVGNLYNVEGLPASPFRTDNWEKPKDK